MLKQHNIASNMVQHKLEVKRPIREIKTTAKKNVIVRAYLAFENSLQNWLEGK